MNLLRNLPIPAISEEYGPGKCGVTRESGFEGPCLDSAAGGISLGSGTILDSAIGGTSLESPTGGAIRDSGNEGSSRDSPMGGAAGSAPTCRNDAERGGTTLKAVDEERGGPSF